MIVTIILCGAPASCQAPQQALFRQYTVSFFDSLARQAFLSVFRYETRTKVGRVCTTSFSHAGICFAESNFKSRALTTTVTDTTFPTGPATTASYRLPVGPRNSLVDVFPRKVFQRLPRPGLLGSGLSLKQKPFQNLSTRRSLHEHLQSV